MHVDPCVGFEQPSQTNERPWFVAVEANCHSCQYLLYVAGLFWVPGGVATVYAVKSAGLAIGIGIGSSFIVLVSFVWGIFVFGEQIHSRFWACFAVFLMILGLFGMSYYSSPVENNEPGTGDGIFSSPEGSSIIYQEMANSRSDDEEDVRARRGNEGLFMAAGGVSSNPSTVVSLQQSKITLTDRTTGTTYSDSLPGSVVADPEDADADSLHPHDGGSITNSIQSHHVVMCGGVVMTKRRLGMLSAMFCGVWVSGTVPRQSHAAVVRDDFLMLMTCGTSCRTGWIHHGAHEIQSTRYQRGGIPD